MPVFSSFVPIPRAEGPLRANDSRSITKRYFTSPLSIRSYASLTAWIGITSTSETIPCSAQ